MNTFCLPKEIDNIVGVLDLGAAWVDDELPIYWPLVELRQCKIVGLEANAKGGERFREKLADYVPVEVIVTVLGDGNKTKMYTCAIPTTSSIYRPNMATMKEFEGMCEAMEVKTRSDVDTVRLDDINLSIRPDLVKSDIQGADFHVLMNAPSTLRKANVLDIEVEFVEQYEGQGMFGDIDSMLRGRGFQFHTFRCFGMRPLSGFEQEEGGRRGFKQILWGNAVYVRAWEEMRSRRTESLVNAFKVLVNCYGSFDFGLRIIREIEERTKIPIVEEYHHYCNKVLQV